MQDFKEKILIIEDSPTQRAILSNLVTELGLEPVVVTSFDSIIVETIQSQSINTVLLDLILVDDDGTPIGDGFQICSDIKNHNPDIKVIVISAESDESAKLFALSQGADGFICKPFEINELEKSLNELSVSN